MDDAEEGAGCRAQVPPARAGRRPEVVRAAHPSAQVDIAKLQSSVVVATQLDALARQLGPSMAGQSSQFASVLAEMPSTFGSLAHMNAAHTAAIANLAAQNAVSPALQEVTRILSSSFADRYQGALSNMFASTEVSRLVTDMTERWTSQHRTLLADINTQWIAQRGTLLGDITRDHQAAWVGKVAGMLNGLDVGGLNLLGSAQVANLVAARSITAGLSEHFRDLGTVSSSWQRIVQGVQLADGLGSVVRLSMVQMPTFASPTLAFGVCSYAAVQRLLGDVSRDTERVLLRGSSLPAAAQLNSYLDSLGARPWRRRADLAGLASEAAAGLVLGESLTAAGPPDEAEEFLSDAATTQLIEPWQEAFDDTRSELFATLDRLSPHLVDLLRGAWFNIKANGPAAASSAANCLVEVLDQTLHALVDDVLLPGWLAENGRVGTEYIDVSSGRPTRRARLAYALQGRSKRDARLALALEAGLTASLAPLHEHLEQAKHGRVDVGVRAVRCHAVTVESLLINLLLG